MDAFQAYWGLPPRLPPYLVNLNGLKTRESSSHGFAPRKKSEGGESRGMATCPSFPGAQPRPFLRGL
jgi:hypothetical protein